MAVKKLEDYAMPVVIYITDATYSMVCALFGKPLDKDIVNKYMRFVWKGPNKFEILSDHEYEKLYKEEIVVGNVIFIASKG